MRDRWTRFLDTWKGLGVWNQIGLSFVVAAGLLFVLSLLVPSA